MNEPRQPAAGPMAAYLAQIHDAPLLSTDEERALAIQVARGDPSARERMVRSNLRLVVHIARSFQGRGLPLEDLVAEGNLGLMRAVEGFDPEVGVRFSTYATYWIRQSIRRSVMNLGKVVRLPSYVHSMLAKWRRAAAVLAVRLGRQPSHEEVGRVLRLSARRLRLVQEALEAEAAASAFVGHAEVDDPMVDLVDARSGRVEDRVVDAELHHWVAERFVRLGEREAAIVRLRFGLQDELPLTLKAIGVRLGLTRERVRQLEKEALSKLATQAQRRPIHPG